MERYRTSRQFEAELCATGSGTLCHQPRCPTAAAPAPQRSPKRHSGRAASSEKPETTTIDIAARALSGHAMRMLEIISIV